MSYKLASRTSTQQNYSPFFSNFQTEIKDTVLTINVVEPALVRAVKLQSLALHRPLNGLVLVHRDYASQPDRPKDKSGLFEEVICDFDNPLEIKEALRPYADRLLAATCRYEEAIQPFAKVIPFLENIHTPSEDSLYYSTEKPLMREQLYKFDKSLVPKYINIFEKDIPRLNDLIKDFSYPLITKPSGLSKALLVNRNDNESELKKNLEKIFALINSVYEREQYPGEPSVLIEEMMQGDMYSLDAYVMPNGDIYCLPLVKVVTAHSVGLAGFYGYERLLPSGITEIESNKAVEAAKKAIKALMLRSTTAHVELFKTKDGWKIIEVAPRIGGFRDVLYREVYGIEHFFNDLSIRMAIQPKINRQPKAHAAVLNIYPDEEGYIKTIEGVNETKNLKSVLQLDIKSLPGQMALFAPNGGNPVIEMVMRNPKLDKLKEDILQAQKILKIKTINK